MSEITNLNVLLKDNQFGNIIRPLIEHAHDPNLREISPFVLLAAARLITERSLSWGNGGMDINKREPTTACVDDCGKGYVLQGWGPCPKSAPCADTSRINIFPGGDASTSIKELARAVKVGDPYTPYVTTFKEQLNGIDTSAVNAYVDWEFMKDVFFANVDFISYFTTTYFDGKYADSIMTLIGGSFRDGFRESGIDVIAVGDGGAGTPATAGDTAIQIGATDAGVDGTYWVIYTSDVTADAIWMDAGVGTLPPVVVIPGIVVTVVGVVINPLDPIDIISLTIAAAFVGYPGYDSVTQSTFDTVTFVTSYTGTRTASDFTNLLGTWVGGFVDGTPVVAGSNERTQINYINSVVRTLIGTWFKMFGAADDGILFYYEKAGVPINPASFGVAYASAIAIPLNERGGNCNTRNCDGYCYQDVCYPNASLYVQKITNDIIIGTGDFIQATVTTACIDDCGKGFVVNGWVCPANYPCDGVREPSPVSGYTTVGVGDFDPAEGGTAAFGAKYQVTDVLAPDGTNFGPSTGDTEYAYIHNTKVVPYMATLGVKYHYLKPISAFPCICCIQTVCPAGCIIIDCPDFQEDTARVGSFMLKTSFASITEYLPYNTPATNFNITVKDVCPSCLT